MFPITRGATKGIQELRYRKAVFEEKEGGMSIKKRQSLRETTKYTVFLSKTTLHCCLEDRGSKDLNI